MNLDHPDAVVAKREHPFTYHEFLLFIEEQKTMGHTFVGFTIPWTFFLAGYQRGWKEAAESNS